MPFRVDYGSSATLTLHLEEDAIAAAFAGPQGDPIRDPEKAIIEAVESPLHFPRLVEATVAGDRIVVALEGGVPCAAAAVSGVLKTLIEGGASPTDLTILRPHDSPIDSDLVARLPANIASQIRILTHDPADRQSLVYLAATHKGDPIYLHRAITDADVVVPIGCLRGLGTLGYSGSHSGLFPTFSDEETQKRFASATWVDSRKESKRRTKESDEAAWLAGNPFAVQIVPGGGEQWLHVLAGDPEMVAHEGESRFDEAWSFSVPALAALVVVGICGGQSEQTWVNLSRALAAAERLVEPDGRIVLCTSLEEPPGAAIGALLESASNDEADRKIHRIKARDSFVAAQLLHTRQQAEIFLLSRLDPGFVEGLEMAPLEDPEDVSRLAESASSCTLLSCGQFVRPRVLTEAAT